MLGTWRRCMHRCNATGNAQRRARVEQDQSMVTKKMTAVKAKAATGNAAGKPARKLPARTDVRQPAKANGKAQYAISGMR